MATKTKTKNYVFHSDPGHGWLAVKRTELDRLGIADKITSFSYQRGGTVYLEEDFDASLFMDAKREACEPYHLRESYTDRDKRIRSFDRYQPTTAWKA